LLILFLNEESHNKEIEHIRFFNLNKLISNNRNKFFFEENQEELNYCKNYGIMIYDYYYEGKLNCPNIGDYIQSIAALQYLPKNCKPYFVDRDMIQF
jgi:hypothetical protein